MSVKNIRNNRRINFAIASLGALGLSACGTTPPPPPLPPPTPEQILAQGKVEVDKMSIDRFYQILKPSIDAKRASNRPEDQKRLDEELMRFAGMFVNVRNAEGILMENLAKDGIDPRTIALPLYRNKVMAQINQLIEPASVQYNEIARAKLILFWLNGDKPLNVSVQQGQPEIIAALTKHPVASCVTAREGNRFNMESVYVTMEEVLAGVSPLEKYGRVAELHQGLLWCVEKGKATGSAPKISLLLTPRQLKEMINLSIAANLAGGWQPGEEFTLTFG